MFCQNCGREISDQAKFCNFCGTPVNTVQTAAPRQSRKTESGKKGKGGRRILSAVIALAVFFLVRTVTYNLLTKPDRTPAAGQTYDTPTIAVADTGLINAMSKCINGTLYEDGYVRYGFARMSLPGYDLLPGEGDEGDCLRSSDRNSLFTASKQLEIIDASYEETTEEGILRSALSTYPDASMIDFRKYQEGGAYVIRYIIRCTDSGTDLYLGELILMPGETCSETIRLFLFQTAETGYDRINQAFDSLSISADYAPDSSETNTVGYNSIAVK